MLYNRSMLSLFLAKVVAAAATEFKPGDEAFREWDVAWALWTSMHAFPKLQSAIVARQGLRDDGEIQPGQTAMINGASGGAFLDQGYAQGKCHHRGIKRVHWTDTEVLRSRKLGHPHE